MVFFTADTHLYHANIIKYCGRPFASVGEMNRTIIENWNAVVSNDDTVYHLGDICFRYPEVIKSLNGKIWLVRGNHDKGFTDTKLKNNGVHMVSKVPIEVEVDGVRVLLMHAPINTSKTASVWLCGHVHEKWFSYGRYINVGVDVRGFKPVTLSDLGVV